KDQRPFLLWFKPNLRYPGVARFVFQSLPLRRQTCALHEQIIQAAVELGRVRGILIVTKRPRRISIRTWVAISAGIAISPRITVGARVTISAGIAIRTRISISAGVPILRSPAGNGPRGPIVRPVWKIAASPVSKPRPIVGPDRINLCYHTARDWR